MKRILAILLSLGLLTALFTGCGSKETATEETTTNETGVVTFTDSCGREVEIPANLERIAGTGSMAQQVLLTIAPDMLVGLSTEITDNQAKYIGSDYQKLPIFGQFYGTSDLNMEALAAADPQLIIDIGDYKDGIEEDMDSIQEQLGIPTIFVDANIENMSEAYTTLGEVLGVEDKAKDLSDYCKDVYSDITEKMATIDEKDRVNFVYVMGDSGLNVIGKGSYHAEVMDLLGNNLAVLDNPSSKGTGDEVSAEQMMLWNPDVVIFGPESIYSTVKDSSSWQGITAIENNTYYEVPNSPYNWMGMPPSVNRYLGMQWMANLFYPEVFDYDMYDVVSDYFKLFYDYNMTKADFNELTANSIK